MYSTPTPTPTSSPSTAALTHLHSPSHHHYLFNFSLFSPIHHRKHLRQIRRTFSVKSLYKPLNPVSTPNKACSFRLSRSNRLSKLPYSIKQEKDVSLCDGGDFLKRFGKPIVLALFWISVGLCPVKGFQVPAIAAAPVASEVNRKRTNTKTVEKDEVLKPKGHEYSDYTSRLLETVSVLLRTIEEVSCGKGDEYDVEVALEEVKSKKQELEDEIMSRLYAELSVLQGKIKRLIKRSVAILEREAEAEGELESRLREEGDNEEEKKVLEEEMERGENEYDEVLDKIDEIEDEIRRRETIALSIGIRELSSIQRECELLVESFTQNFWRRKDIDSKPEKSLTKLSRFDIEKGLQTAQRQLWEQTILPSVLENEDIEHAFQQDGIYFAQRIKQALEDSREMQRNLEADIRKKMKRVGDEKRFVVNSPVDEIVKGFPEVDLKWMFGGKEVVVPKAAGLRLFHGWKKWREEVKADLKRDLLENVELGKKYVAQRQEHILLDRDRVASKTWYSEERKTWEMDPIAVPYAVSRKLVENARIRHDWGAMYITLKGDDREYYVDIKEFEMLFEDFGGFDGLYLRMIASGIPTVVQLMWIPFSELDFRQQFLLLMRISQRRFTELLKNEHLHRASEWLFKNIRDLNEDILTLIVFPLVEFVVPYPVRLQLGMAWPKYMDQSGASTWYLKWQVEVDESFRSRNDSLGFKWFLWFFLRGYIYLNVVSTIFTFVRRNIPELPGYGPLRENPSSWKSKRVLIYTVHKYIKLKYMGHKGRDPITEAFDQMKRVKNPPIPLKDFSSVESMKEEIYEVVAFLQNPLAFQEMGARAPRGVLIVGETGTGKTSLALAIAAEAKVPVVKVNAEDLESTYKIGQSASNIRELFQTARDLAPIIILVEDFDLFAGVRGKFIHTKKQDHEAFINQLLVELDGFEKQDGVLLLATTQNPKQIDEALRRPGRMDRIFYLQHPTQGEREKILRLAARKSMDEELIDFVDWKKVAEKTACLRPIELKLVPVALEGSAFRSKFLDTDELLTYCSWFATFSWIVPTWVRKTKFVRTISKILVNHLGLALTKEDLQNVVDLMEPYGQISDGIELMNPPRDWTRETKFPHAVWAAGRGLISHLLPNFDVVENLWLEPSSWQGIGCTKITKAKNEGSMSGYVESRSYLEKKLVFYFGSYVAAQLLLPFGEENILSASELKKAQETATRMVIQYGWSPDDNPAVYHYGKAAGTLSMGNNHRYEIAERVEKIYYLAFDKAKAMLRSNRKVLEYVVEALLDFEVLTGKDLERIVADNGGILEKEPFSLSSVHVDEPVFRSLIENGNASGTTVLSAES
ncbi:hypothetical protein LguiA_000831 [Lonicera macranthoides]